MQQTMPYLIDYVFDKDETEKNLFIPQKKFALLLRGRHEETRHDMYRYNAALIQTIDTLIHFHYDFVYVLGHGHLIHGGDSLYGYSTLLTQEHLEQQIHALRRSLTPEDRLLTVVTGLQNDVHGAVLPLYNGTTFRGNDLHALLSTIPARQILYSTLGSLATSLVEQGHDGAMSSIFVSPTTPAVQAPSPLSFASRHFYQFFFQPQFFPSLQERFQSAALRAAQEAMCGSLDTGTAFCAYLRHSPHAHAERNYL